MSFEDLSQNVQISPERQMPTDEIRAVHIDDLMSWYLLHHIQANWDDFRLA